MIKPFKRITSLIAFDAFICHPDHNKRFLIDINVSDNQFGSMIKPPWRLCPSMVWRSSCSSWCIEFINPGTNSFLYCFNNDLSCHSSCKVMLTYILKILGYCSILDDWAVLLIEKMILLVQVFNSFTVSSCCMCSYKTLYSMNKLTLLTCASRCSEIIYYW